MRGASKGDEEVQVPVVDQHLQSNDDHDDNHGDRDDDDEARVSVVNTYN